MQEGNTIYFLLLLAIEVTLSKRESINVKTGHLRNF